jgi:hypothetical protein
LASSSLRRVVSRCLSWAEAAEVAEYRVVELAAQAAAELLADPDGGVVPGDCCLYRFHP